MPVNVIISGQTKSDNINLVIITITDAMYLKIIAN